MQQAGELTEIWREIGTMWRVIGRLEATAGGLKREIRDSKAKGGASLMDRISATEKWVVRGIQIMLAGTTAWATGSLTKGLEMLSLLAK
jgi:hypothetical protein